LTDRNARERRIQELQAELAHVQRLTELGQFVSTLVHEVNQPLTAIATYANACRRLVTVGDFARLAIPLDRIVEHTSGCRDVSGSGAAPVARRPILPPPFSGDDRINFGGYDADGTPAHAGAWIVRAPAAIVLDGR
jgi:signal transduction histidine kinase